MNKKTALFSFLLIVALLFSSCTGKKTQENGSRLNEIVSPNENQITEEKHNSEIPITSHPETKAADIDINETITEKNANDLNFPQKINLFQYNKGSDSRLYGLPSARMWGWSSNGKAAYSIERAVDGRGGQIILFVILDTITDKAVYELEIDSFNFADIENEGLYNILKIEILNALKEHNITDERTQFQPFPFKRNNIEYNAHVADVEYKDDEYGFFEKVVTKYKVSVTADKKKKVISDSVPERSLTSNVSVCGYFLSPYENRALIVTAEEAFVFEGTELFYQFAGCHLGSGFK